MDRSRLRGVVVWSVRVSRRCRRGRALGQRRGSVVGRPVAPDYRVVEGTGAAHFVPVRDRGRVLADVAVMLAGGGGAIADIDLSCHQAGVLRPIASTPTGWRAPTSERSWYSTWTPSL